MRRRVSPSPDVSRPAPDRPCHPGPRPEIPERASGRTTHSGAYPINHHVAGHTKMLEHPDKAGHPRATPTGPQPGGHP